MLRKEARTYRENVPYTTLFKYQGAELLGDVLAELTSGVEIGAPVSSGCLY